MNIQNTVKEANPRAQMQKPRVRDRLAPREPALDDDTFAECCLLLTLIARKQPARLAEFFNIRGGRHEKIGFLLRYGHFELENPKQ